MKLVLAALVLGAAGCSGQSGDSPIARNDNGSPARATVAHTAAGDIALTGRVVDQAGIILPADEQRLTQQLARLERETTDQVVIVTLPSLNGEAIEKVGLALGNGWGIGQADTDNGVLLLVAPHDRKVRIEVGLGLEGLLTDARAAKIIEMMLPSFRAGKPAEAIERGVGEISILLRSDLHRPQRVQRKIAA